MDASALITPVGQALHPIMLSILAIGNGIQRSPARLDFLRIDPRHLPVQRDVVLYAVGHSFHVLWVQCPPEITASWTHVEGSMKLWKVDVTYRGGWPAGKHDAVKKIVTDDTGPSGGIAVVPLHAEVLP